MFDLGRRLLLEISSRPIEVLVGICLFATAASGGSMASVASSSMAILFIVSLFYVKQWSELWYALSRNEKLLLAGLSMYAFTGLISYFNSSDEYEFVKHMGRYVRFLFVVPIYLLMTRNNMQLLKYLVAGAIFSGPFNLAVALISIAEWPEIPASGYYHWITFGDAAMLSVVFLSAILLTGKTGAIMKAMIIISIICAFYASILSQSRGAWLALPVCLLILTYIMIRYGELRNRLKIILPTLLLIVAVIGTSPIRDLIENRAQEAVQEIELFVSGEKIDTSIGGRLAMWDIAIDVWQKHPVIGTGLGDFDLEIESRQSQGIYETIAVHGSTHNIYLQALATTGTAGFLILCFALIIQPIRVFYSKADEQLTPARLAGVIVVVAYAVFGLTESWILRAPVVSMFLIYLVTLSTVACRAQDNGNDGVKQS